MARVYTRKGQTFVCIVCNKPFYRTPGQIRRGATRTCSRACMGVRVAGEGNPFWGRHHDDETRAAIAASRKGKGVGHHHGLGYRHTEEARQRIGEASRRLWAEHRDTMLQSLPRGEQHHFHKLPVERRYRLQFTPRQRREWAADQCAYCGSTEYLELDHVVPIFDGGRNVRENAQTLCRGCNLWKTEHVDLPRYNATLVLRRG